LAYAEDSIENPLPSVYRNAPHDASLDVRYWHNLSPNLAKYYGVDKVFVSDWEVFVGKQIADGIVQLCAEKEHKMD
jgi:hypothetical protein